MALYNNITVKAYGKINLLLDIPGLRNDGYHQLNTVMQSVSCFDLLRISLTTMGSGIEIICDKEDFPCNENNLIWKACIAFKEYTKIDFGGKLTIKVKKNLPSQAGMAGGSADCAATLHALNKMYAANLDEEELCEIGVKLGADVPFCITGGTRLCQGIGEITHKLPSPKCCFIIVKPNVSISTPEAFKKFDLLTNPPRANLDMFLRSLATNNIYSQCLHMFNVLELATNFEEIKLAKEELMNIGAINALMTGSGSAVFGVFNDLEFAKSSLNKLSDYAYKVVCEPVKSGWELMEVY